MRSTLLWAVVAALAPPLFAQNVRGTVLVANAAGDALGPAVASAGETSVVAFEDSAGEQIFVCRSDGRGLAWAPPVRADDGTTAAPKYLFADAVDVAGSRVYVSWRDERNGPDDDIYFNFSADGGRTFQPADTRIAKGLPGGANPVRDHVMALDARSASGGDDLVAFLISVENSGTGNEELYVTYSLDSGLNWVTASVTAHNASPTSDVDEIALAAQGGQLFCLWRDDFLSSPDDDVWFSRLDAASGLWLQRDVQLDANSAGTYDADDSLAIAVSGSTVVAAWQADLAASGGPEVLFVNASNNGGGAWTGDQMVGGYRGGVDDVDSPDVVASASRIVVAWLDNRSGSDQVYAATATAPLFVFGSDMLLSSGPAGGAPRFCGGGSVLGLSWTSGALPDHAAAAFSRDGGASWRPELAVSANAADVDAARMAHNSAYNNFVAAWLADDLGGNDVYAGGFRPQTLTPNGTFAAGSPVSFAISHWPASEATDYFGVLASASPGDWRLPDGRNSGLAYDAYLAQTVAVNRSAVTGGRVPGPLTGFIGGDGTGATSTFPFPAGVPPGTTLHLVAVGFDVPPLRPGSVTDVGLVAVQ